MADHTDALTASLRALSAHLLGDETPRDGLRRIAEMGESAIDGADVTGLTLLDEHGRPRTFVCTDDRALNVDQLQYDEGNGPCLTAYREGQVVRIGSNRVDQRWPAFSRRACEQGVLSSLSTPLLVDGNGLGAINFYAEREEAFTEADEQLGLAFAGQAAVIVANAQAYWGAREHSLHLDEATRSRAVIEQAKGIVMARSNLSAEAAFDVLRRVSQRENRTLHEVAIGLVERTRRAASISEPSDPPSS